MTEFSANIDRLMQAQNGLEASEKTIRRAHCTKMLATAGIVLVATFTIAYFIGLGLLYLMPYE